MSASSTKSIVIGLIVGLIIGLVMGYIFMEQKVSRLEAQIECKDGTISRLESQIAERDSLIDMFLRMKDQGDLISSSGKVIVATMITLTDLDGHREFFADLKKDEMIHVQIHVMGAPINFYVNKGTLNLIQKTETLSEDFTWTIPEEGRYVFRTELKGYEYALVVLRIAPAGGTILGLGPAAQEKVAIESVQATTTSLSLWAKSTGGGDIVLTGIIIRDAAGNVVGAPVTILVTLPADGTLTQVGPVTVALTAGRTYTAALVSKAGSQFVSPSFKA